MNKDVNVPSILVRGNYDNDLSPKSAHNVEAAKRYGLRYDPAKQAFIDEDGCLIRDKYFQIL